MPALREMFVYGNVQRTPEEVNKYEHVFNNKEKKLFKGEKNL